MEIEAGGVLDRAALGIGIGLIRRRAHVEDVGVEGVARMEMEIAEVGVAQRIGSGPLGGGSLALLGGAGRLGLAAGRQQRRQTCRDRKTLHDPLPIAGLSCQLLVTGQYDLYDCAASSPVVIGPADEERE